MSNEQDALTALGLDAESVKSKLLLAGLFLTAYELVREQIVDRTKWFFSDHFTPEGPRESAEYRARILSGHPNAFAGSVSWLQGMNVLNADDAEYLLRIRDQRNRLVHELPSVVLGREFGVDPTLLNRCRELVVRVGRFWARVEIDTDEELAGQEIDDEEIAPGPAILLEYLTTIAVDAISPRST